jgi:DNA-binding response OmpR family regulator
MRLGNILLVGSKIPPTLVELLLDSGSHVRKISTGKRAVSHAQREMFDLAVIISTGDEMDLAETIFNLSDINGSMQFIVVSERARISDAEISKKSLQRAVPNTRIMSLKELRRYLVSPPKEA